MLGRESAIEGASADASGGRMPLVDMDGSNVAMMKILGEEGVVTLMCLRRSLSAVIIDGITVLLLRNAGQRVVSPDVTRCKTPKGRVGGSKPPALVVAVQRATNRHFNKVIRLKCLTIYS